MLLARRRGPDGFDTQFSKRHQRFTRHPPANLSHAGRVEDGRGGSCHLASPRFPSPLIERSMRISRTTLSDWLHRKARNEARDRRRVSGGRRLRLAAELLLTGPDDIRCLQALANHHAVAVLRSAPEVRVLPSTGVTRPQQDYDPVRHPRGPPHVIGGGRYLRHMGLPQLPGRPPDMPCPLPRWTERVHLSVASPSTRPSPLFRRVGVHDFTFEACSGFTHVTARWIAQPPKAAFVTRLRPGRLPDRAARQLPGLPTTPGWNLPPLVIRAVGAH